MNFIRTALIFDKRYTECHWGMLNSHRNAVKVFLFGQTVKQPLVNTKQPLNDFES